MENSNTERPPPKDKDDFGASNNNKDDSSSDDDSSDNTGQELKKIKHHHSHSSCSNVKNTRQQQMLSFNHNANVNLGTVFRTENNFLSQHGIVSESLASFQKLDRTTIPVTSPPDCSRSVMTENRLRLMRSRPKIGRNKYIINVMNQGSNANESSITDQQVEMVSERDQRAHKRNQTDHESCSVANHDHDILNSQNTIDRPAADSSSSVNSGVFDLSHISNEDSDNIIISTMNNNGGNDYDLHNQQSNSSRGSNAYNSVNESNNTNHNVPTPNNESSSHLHCLEQMRQAEYDLHQHTQGTARFNNEQIACIELAHILDECDAPKIVFDQIIKWAAKHRANLTNNPPSRVTFYNKLETTLSFKKHLPEKIVVDLSGNKASEVTRHDPASSIFSLLTSKDLPNGDKRYIFGSRPDLFTPQTDGTSRNDITSSRWFNNTYQKYLRLPIYQDGSRQFIVVPIIMFIDETHLDRQGSATICPVSYTLGIFNELTNKNPHAWRHLGFVPKDVVRSVIGNSHKENKRLKLADFHSHLRAILEPLIAFQSNGPYQWVFKDLCPIHPNDVPGASNQEYDLFFPLAYIIGDIKGHNILTMRYNDHNKSNSISRECNCLRTNGYQSPTRCEHIYYKDIKQLQDTAINGRTAFDIKNAKKLLQKKSFHFGNINAFDGMDFGENKYGINFACTPCLLHTWQLRFPDDIFNAFIEKTLGKSDNNSSITTFLDACPDIIRSCVRQSDRTHLDISPFSIAIMKDKLYYAKEKHARLFAIYIYAMTTYSYTMTNDISIHNEFLKLIELSLCLYEYLYQPHFPIHDCEPLEPNDFQCRANIKIGHWKKIYKRVLDIEEEDLKFPKWHDLDHFGAYIDFFGSAKHADGGPSESNFIDTAKRPAKRSNKLRTRINHDVATDLTHRRLVKVARNVLHGGQADNIINNGGNVRPIEEVTNKNSRSSIFGVHLRPDRSAIDIIWKKDNVEPLMSYSQRVQDELFQLLFSRLRGILQGPMDIVSGFTTLNHKGVIYRGHPWFNPALPWYDYAYINWDEDDDDIPNTEEVRRQRLAKIICFLDLSNHNVKEHIDHGLKGHCVVVQSILETDIDDGYTPTKKALDVMQLRNLEDREDHLQLVTCWELEKNCRILPVSMIADAAFAFQDIVRGEEDKLEHGECVFEVRKRKDWRNLFNPRNLDPHDI
jgi:hypothetical protein